MHRWFDAQLDQKILDGIYTNGYTILRISRNSVALLPAKSANSDSNTYIFPLVPNSTSFYFFQWKLILICLLNPILCKYIGTICLLRIYVYYDNYDEKFQGQKNLPNFVVGMMNLGKIYFVVKK